LFYICTGYTILQYTYVRISFTIFNKKRVFRVCSRYLDVPYLRSNNYRVMRIRVSMRIRGTRKRARGLGCEDGAGCF
jgi:hypothetical protein